MLDYELKHAGDTALVVEFGESVDRDVSSRVVALADALRSLEAPGVVELIPTFRSLMIRYEPVHIGADELNGLVAKALALGAPARSARRRWTIPVCFDDPYSLDGQSVAEFASLGRDELAQTLCAQIFHVYMLGFLPGQPYLGDLPDAFDMPRLRTPRTSIPAGSVGIAKRLVCIYPAETPCGWHIVGRCAARLWQSDGPLLRAGDEVRLQPTPARMFDASNVFTPLAEELSS